MVINHDRSGSGRLRTRLILAGAICLLLLVIAYLCWMVFPGVAMPRLARSFGLDISYSGLRVGPGLSVVIHDVLARPAGKTGPNEPILRAGYVKARLGLLGVLLMRPRLASIEAEDVELRLVHDPNGGAWNVGQARWTSINGSQRLPQVRLKGGKVILLATGPGDPEPVHTIHVDGLFQSSDKGSYLLDLTTGTGDKSIHLVGNWTKGRIYAEGRFSTSQQVYVADKPDIGLELTYDARTDYRLKVCANGIAFDQATEVAILSIMQPMLFGKLDPLQRLKRLFERFQPSGKIDLELFVDGNLGSFQAKSCQGIVSCKGLAICDRRFPYPLEDLKGQIDIDPNGFTGRRLTARHGDAGLLINFWAGAGPNEGAYDVKILGTNLLLDQALYQALGPGLQRLWSAFDPNGRIGLQYTISRHAGGQERYNLLVKPAGVDFVYDGFPYPLKGLRGEILFEPEQVTLSNLTANAQSGLVQIDGTTSGLDVNDQALDLTINAIDIPFGQTLAHALNSTQRAFYERLEPDGLLDAQIRVKRTSESLGPPQIVADITLKDAAVTVLEGKSRLTRVNGKAQLTDQGLIVKGISCAYGAGRLVIQGQMPVVPEHGSSQDWSIDGYGVDLNDLARDLPGWPGPWLRSLGANGPVDLQAYIQMGGPRAPAVYQATINCQNDRLMPQAIPIPIIDLTGQVRIDNRSILLKELSFRMADRPGRIAVDGSIHTDPNGTTLATIGLLGQEVAISPALLNWLPKPWVDTIGSLDISGLVHQASGIVHLHARPGGAVGLDIHGDASVGQLKVNLGLAKAEVAGQLQLTISYGSDAVLKTGRICLSDGQVMVNDRTADRLTAVLVFDQPSGRWVSDQLQGRFCNGLLTGTVQIRSDQARPRFEIELSTIDAALGMLGRNGQDTGHSSGLMDAWIGLCGYLTSPQEILGQCRVKVRQIQVGRSSLLWQLLDIMRLREPSDYTFDRLEVDSYIKRNNVLIERFDMSGGSAAFQGSGTLDLSRDDLDLTLIARSRKRLSAAEPTSLQALTEGLGGGVARMEIRGKSSNPRITTRPLPVLEEPFRLLGTIR